MDREGHLIWCVCWQGVEVKLALLEKLVGTIHKNKCSFCGSTSLPVMSARFVMKVPIFLMKTKHNFKLTRHELW